MSNKAPGFASHPGHRVDISAPEHVLTLRRSSTIVARTRSAILLEESGYPARYYIPATDFGNVRLEPSKTSSYCPFKGEASYWNVMMGDETLQDALWGYQTPYDECLALAGYRGFYAEQFSVETA